MTQSETPHRTFAEQRMAAALDMIGQQEKRRRAVADLVVPPRTHGPSPDRVSEVTFIRNDAVVRIVSTRRCEQVTRYATVVGGKTDHVRFEKLDHALLHLLARRYGAPDSDGGITAAFAARVLGIPEDRP